MKSSKKTILLCISVAVISALIAGGGVFLFMRQTRDSNMNKIANVYEDIQKNYYENVDQKKLRDGAIKGMLAALDDPYTTFLDRNQSEQINQTLNSTIGGIGATITKEEDAFLIIEKPQKSSPAFKAGLQQNDEIIAVNQQPTTGLTLKELVEKVRGKVGSKVTLQIKRNEQIFDVTIVRTKIHVPTVASLVDQKQPAIAKIQIKSFSSGTADDLKKEVQALRKQKVNQFILDLRQNSGGLLIEGEKVASMFLKDEQTIVKFEEKGQLVSTVKASSQLDGKFKISEPTIVLIDGQTASAAEIVAAALNESGNKILIGQQSFGKGTVQTINNLSNNEEIKMSTQKWLTPKGKWIHEKGLTPTIKVSLPTAEQLNTLNNSLTYNDHYSTRQKKLLIPLLRFVGYEINLEQFDQEFSQALLDIQVKNNLETTGKINQETIEKLNELIFSKYLKEDIAYEEAINQLIRT